MSRSVSFQDLLSKLGVWGSQKRGGGEDGGKMYSSITTIKIFNKKEVLVLNQTTTKAKLK